MTGNYCGKLPWSITLMNAVSQGDTGYALWKK